MDCWARINGKDYPIAYGWTLTEEFSETLDSASIILPHVREILSIKPYDDVIIHDYNPSVSPLPPRPYGQVFSAEGHFYKHMLVGSFTREKVSIESVQNLVEIENTNRAQEIIDETMNDETLTDDEKAAIIEAQYTIIYENRAKDTFNYHIELVSETKGLETVQLPNKTISQPMGTTEEGISIDSYNGVSFLEGYFLPSQNTVNVWTDGYKVYETRLNNVYTWYRLFVFAGDMSSETNDYSIFSKVQGKIRAGDYFNLPDWNISGVTAVYSTTTFWDWKIEQQETFTPKKHWIIVRKGVHDDRWTTRDRALSNIKSYLSGATFEEIENEAFNDGERDIYSEEPVSIKKVKMPALDGVAMANYDIYLYIEPKIFTSINASLPKFNVFGMIRNGQTLDENSEFLAVWSVTASSTLSFEAKGVMTVYEAIREAVELYSPYVKITKDGSTWQYIRKYSIAEETKNFFMSVVAPENQWNYPNLRDYITRLFYVDDCIPIVKDNVISHICLSQRNPEPFVAKEGCISYENYSMDGSSYCDRLLRTYTDGLSKDNVTNCVERIGFKNADSSLLTLENLRLELSHPIYRINKVYMCHYNRFYTKDGVPSMRMCKWDITPLVLLNSQRNFLSEDWSALYNNNTKPTTISELANFKYATVGYDIGSQYISGWGAKYNVPSNVFWTATHTTIENIFDFVSKRNILGVYDPSENMSGYYQNGEADIFPSNADENRYGMEQSGDSQVVKEISQMDLIQNTVLGAFFGNFTQRLKTLTFIVEYQGYISSAVLASKDFHDGNVVSRDNASSSLSFVESDGINQKEKANRLGNATITVPARYVSYDDIQTLAKVWNDDAPKGQTKLHEDEVLFKRTIAFYKDYFSVSYYLCKNYILRNYFTSVFSKHRPFPLASYEQSVERQENKTLEVLISPDKAYWQEDSKRVGFSYDVNRLFSFFTSSSYDSNGKLIVNNGIDASYYCVYPSKSFIYKGQSGIFAVDNQKFVSGNSLCFVVSMKDNVSAGVFVGDFNHNVGQFVWESISNGLKLLFGGAIADGYQDGYWNATTTMAMSTNLLTGAKQDWYMFPIDPLTGMLYSMSFGVGFQGTEDVYATKSFQEYSDYDIASAQMVPLMDVVLKRKDKDIYFGADLDGYKVGLGYPRLKLVPTGYNDKFKVDFSNKDQYFTYAQVVQEKSKNETFDFARPNIVNGLYVPVPIAERNNVTEFLYAKFVGRETPSYEEETDTCVFKDGKERISTTIQVEPISEDKRVAFSSYLMKLSDAMGGLEKNYSEQIIYKNITFMFGVSQIRGTSTSGDDLSGVQQQLYSIPSLTIAIPKSQQLAGSLEINKTWTASGKNGNISDYELTIHQIKGIQVVGNQKILVASATIKFGETSIDEDLYFELLNGKDVIEGRTQNSDFPASICYDAGQDYDCYVFCEDGFFYSYSGTLISFKYSKYLNGEDPFPESYDGATDNTLVRLSLYAGAGQTIQAYNFSNGYLQNDGMNYINFDLFIFSSLHKAVKVGINNYNLFVFDQGPTLDGEGIKPKTMYWCIGEAITTETPYEVLSEEPKNPLSILPNDNIFIGKTSNGIYRLQVKPNSYAKGSIRFYYLQDNVYHFVFGFNASPALQEGEQTDDNYIYPDTDGFYNLYLSFLDDRSKSVINDIDGDDHQGDSLYKVANYLDENEVSPSLATPINICVEK